MKNKIEYKKVQRVVDGKKSPLIKTKVPYVVVNESAELVGDKAVKAMKLLDKRSVIGQMNDIRELVLEIAEKAGVDSGSPKFRAVNEFNMAVEKLGK